MTSKTDKPGAGGVPSGRNISIGDGIVEGDVDDPTDVHVPTRTPGATQISDLPGDVTDPDPVPGALVPDDAVLVKLDGVVGPFSVMESDFLDAVNGKRTLGEVARVLALNIR